MEEDSESARNVLTPGIEQAASFGKEYHVDKYDELCEEHFRIIKIVPLKKSIDKIILNIFLNIITIFTINYFYGFSDKFKKKFVYSECNLENCEILGIYCNDKCFYFTEIKKVDLPKITNPDIITSQSNIGRICYLFTFKLFIYIFNPSANCFNSIKYSIFHTKKEIFELMSNGLSQEEKNFQKISYGDCDLNFKIDSFCRTLFLNTCNFFFAFQIYSIVLWALTEYIPYSCLIAAMTLFDLLQDTISYIKNLKSIRKIARYSIPIKIYKKNENSDFEKYEIINDMSVNLVPGDVFELPDDGQAMPCDCILLSGSVIINEAMLTGESTPIIKSHLPNIIQNFDAEKDSKYFLYSGTKIVQKRSENKKPVIALCYSTGFNTIKGNLIRSILYPGESDQKFENDSYKFIIFMALLCVVAFFSFLPIKIINIKDNDKIKDKRKKYIGLIKQGLDLITTAVPPALPCCLGIGISIAQSRFKKKRIMCINRDKINPAGKINICVFDKTGTLTEDHLNIAGFLPVIAHSREKEAQITLTGSKNEFVFDEFTDSVKNLSKNNSEYYKRKMTSPSIRTKKEELIQLYIECLACCQGITRVNGKLIGDPIDVEMFESTDWELIEEITDSENYDTRIQTYVRPKGEQSLTEKREINQDLKDHYEIGIIRRFDFSSKLQRMSTLVKNIFEPNIVCYCKGSPEKIRELCLEKTIPANFTEQLNNYTSRGYRVLAMGAKIIKMDYEQALEISRSSCEKELIFLGLLIVQNKLKEATNRTLQILTQDANIRVRMATGDNIMTAVCVGRKSNLIDPDSIVYSCEIEKVETEEEIENIITRKSISLYENNKEIQKEKEKEQIKKKLVWKTVQSFQEEEEEDNKIIKSLIRNSVNISYMDGTNRLSCLLPIEVNKNDMKPEDEL